MSTHQVADERNVQPIFLVLHEAGFIASVASWDAGVLTLEFARTLTPEEQATVDDIVSVGDAAVRLTRPEFAAIRPHLQTIRDLRQMGRNAFMALTAAERDRLLYDAQAATTTILLALLRD